MARSEHRRHHSDGGGRDERDGHRRRLSRGPESDEEGWESYHRRREDREDDEGERGRRPRLDRESEDEEEMERERRRREREREREHEEKGRGQKSQRQGNSGSDKHDNSNRGSDSRTPHPSGQDQGDDRSKWAKRPSLDEEEEWEGEQKRLPDRKDERRRTAAAGRVEAGLSLPPSKAQLSTTTHVKSSKVLLLHNIFDKSVERDMEFYLRIREEVHTMCSKKGSVVHAIHVDRHDGCLWLRCDSIRSASQAKKMFDGNLFDGRMISCSFMDLIDCNRRFG